VTLINDLSFWEEVQRFKALAHQQHRSITLVHDKAQALISQYLDSEIPPQIQVSVPREIAQGIRLKKGAPTKTSIQIYMFRGAEEKTFYSIFQHYPSYLRHVASERAALLNGEKLDDRTARAVERLYLGGATIGTRRGIILNHSNVGMMRQLHSTENNSQHRLTSDRLSTFSNKSDAGTVSSSKPKRYSITSTDNEINGSVVSEMTGSPTRKKKQTIKRRMEFISTTQFSVSSGISTTRQDLMSRYQA